MVDKMDNAKVEMKAAALAASLGDKRVALLVDKTVST